MSDYRTDVRWCQPGWHSRHGQHAAHGGQQDEHRHRGRHQAREPHQARRLQDAAQHSLRTNATLTVGKTPCLMHPLHTNTTPTVGKTPCLMHYSALPAHRHNTNSRENTVSDALLNTPCAQTQHWQSGKHRVWCTLCTQTQHRQSGKHRVWCTTQHSLHTDTTLTVGKTPCLMHYSTLPAHKHNTDSRENTVSDAPSAHKHNTDSRENTVSDALLSTPCTQTQH